MNVIRRQFTGQPDIQAMATLVRDFPTDNVHVTDLPYRFSSWALDDPGNVALWVHLEGRVLAWAILQTPFWTIDFAFHPQADLDLRHDLWDWADHRAQDILVTPYGHPAWFVNVFADQTETIWDLEQAGFASQANVREDSWSKVLLSQSVDTAQLEVSLPAGFTIRHLAGASEVDAYLDLHRTVFESRNMTGEWRRRTLRQPEYFPELDLVAVAPDDRLAGFCVGWLRQGETGEIIGQIEPMGVHSNYRQMGLGKAILSENLRRLHQNGAKQVFIETDNYRNPALALYEAVGFRVFREILVFRKDYSVG